MDKIMGEKWCFFLSQCLFLQAFYFRWKEEELIVYFDKLTYFKGQSLFTLRISIHEYLYDHPSVAGIITCSG